MVAAGEAPVRVPTSVGGLRRGLFAGEVTVDPVSGAPRGGRVRRWTYVAAGDGASIVGAAVVDLGVVGVVFGFAAVGGRTATWEVTRPLARGVRVGVVPGRGAAAHVGDGHVALGGDGAIDLDVATTSGRLRAEVRPLGQVLPVTLATRTPAGGWNVTQKAAGTPVVGAVQLGEGASVAFTADAGGWSDWTVGRQDRRTTWRWAAGAGVAAGGRRVGINASTGMNGQEAGEDVVWWDKIPYGLPVAELAPETDDPRRDWCVRGPGVDLGLSPLGVRSADERLVVATSSYVQPFGRWRGALIDPLGGPRSVNLAGVAEDHLAVW